MAPLRTVGIYQSSHEKHRFSAKFGLQPIFFFA